MFVIVDWLKQLSSGLDAVTDVFNVGRLTFYAPAGLLVVYVGRRRDLGPRGRQGPCSLVCGKGRRDR
jgi:hypothetical protein